MRISRFFSSALWMQSSNDIFWTPGVYVCASAATLAPAKINDIPSNLIAGQEWGIGSLSSNKHRSLLCTGFWTQEVGVCIIQKVRPQRRRKEVGRAVLCTPGRDQPRAAA